MLSNTWLFKFKNKDLHVLRDGNGPWFALNEIADMVGLSHELIGGKVLEYFMPEEFFEHGYRKKIMRCRADGYAHSMRCVNVEGARLFFIRFPWRDSNEFLRWAQSAELKNLYDFADSEE